MNTYIARIQIVEALGLSGTVKQRIIEYIQQTGQLPSNNDEAGLGPGKHYGGKYTQSIDVDEGVIHLKMREEGAVSRWLKGGILSLRPLILPSDGVTVVAWLCGTEKPPPELATTEVFASKNRTDINQFLLPTSCR
ncbi:MAG: pilin [Thiotrichales bacterium]